MCNFYNTTGYYGNGRCGGSIWDVGTQYLCRDCNGNIRVNQRNTCGCQNGGCACQRPCCQCSCGCGENGNTGNGTGTSDNGGFTCVTVCGNGANAQQTGTSATNNGGYYGRQCGRCSGGYTRSCGYGFTNG